MRPCIAGVKGVLVACGTLPAPSDPSAFGYGDACSDWLGAEPGVDFEVWAADAANTLSRESFRVVLAA